jgi:WD40 repeat protein
MAQTPSKSSVTEMRIHQLHASPPAIVVSLHTTAKSSVALSLDNGEIWLFDLQAQRKAVLRGHEKAVWAFASVDHYLISGSADTNIIIWDLDTSLVLFFPIRLVLVLHNICGRELMNICSGRSSESYWATKAPSAP